MNSFNSPSFFFFRQIISHKFLSSPSVQEWGAKKKLDEFFGRNSQEDDLKFSFFLLVIAAKKKKKKRRKFFWVVVREVEEATTTRREKSLISCVRNVCFRWYLLEPSSYMPIQYDSLDVHVIRGHVFVSLLHLFSFHKKNFFLCENFCLNKFSFP